MKSEEARRLRDLEIENQKLSEMLADLIATRGVPKYIRSDNGPEFISRR